MTSKYEINQIFENTYPPQAAFFCNENGLRMVELPLKGKTRRFQIQKALERTDDQKKTLIRCRRNELLRATDFTQSSDAPFDASTKQRYAVYRQYLRDLPEQPEFPDVFVQSYEEWCK